MMKLKLSLIGAIIDVKTPNKEITTKASNGLYKLSLSDLKSLWAVVRLGRVEHFLDGKKTGLLEADKTSNNN